MSVSELSEIGEFFTQDNSRPRVVYKGKIEEFKSDFEDTGYLKVRVDILHGDKSKCPTAYLPWAKVTRGLLAKYKEWKEPKKYKVKAKVLNSPKWTFTSNTSCGGEGCSPSTETQIDEGTIQYLEIEPDPYTLRPYRQYRESGMLLQEGDEVLVVLLNSNSHSMVVVDIMKFKEEG